MTPAAVFCLACLASAHALTETEIAATLRAARATGPTITVAAIEDAITAVIVAREEQAA